MNIPSVGNESMTMGRQDIEDQFTNECSGVVSMSQDIGFRKVEVQEVLNSDSCMPVTIEASFIMGDNSTISVGPTNNKDFQFPRCNNKDESSILIGPTLNFVGENLSLNNISNKGDGSFILMGHRSNKGVWVQPFDKGCGSLTAHSYGRGDGESKSMDRAFDNGHENIALMDSNNNKAKENSILVGSPYKKMSDTLFNKVGEDTRSLETEADTDIAPKGTIHDKSGCNIPSMVQNCNTGEISTISFGGFNNEPETNSSGNCNINSLINKSSDQALRVVGQKEFVESSVAHVVVSSSKDISKTNATACNMEANTAKKVSPFNFPASVNSLLSSGILDGVPVKYCSWSRDKSLRGVIEGTKYKCSCKECNLTKCLNAYEFESHTGCKTNRPHFYIYFENGKSIFAVAQELKHTPLEKLPEVVQNVTGSPLNQKNFLSWKESFEAAMQKLQSIN